MCIRDRTKIQNEFEKYFLNNENQFGKFKYISINKDFDILSEKNKFDMVLTFRNSHNWLKNKKAEEITNVVNAAKYHLVVGCFSNINNAQRLVSKLNDQGHSSKIIGQNNRGLHMVAFDSYASKSDARRDQKVLSTEGVSTWIKSNK